jgi:hypothetical protein
MRLHVLPRPSLRMRLSLRAPGPLATPGLDMPVLTATPGDGEVDLAVGPVSGATSYIYERSLTAVGGFGEIQSTASLTYKDTGRTNGVTYYYRSKASNGIVESDYSDVESATPAVASFALDAFSAPIAAAGLYRYRTAYAGPAAKVRRSSDDAEADIGFDAATGQIDKVALAAHLAGSGGFVRTWYDPSGNGRHLQQATTALQPRIAEDDGTILEDDDGHVYLSGSDNGGVVMAVTGLPGGTLSTTDLSCFVLCKGEKASLAAETEVLRLGAVNDFSFILTNTATTRQRIGGTVNQPAFAGYRGYDRDIWRVICDAVDVRHYGGRAAATPIAQGPALAPTSITIQWPGRVYGFVIYPYQAAHADIFEALNDLYQFRPTAPNTGAGVLLPQHHNWQVVMYDYLETQVVADVDLAASAAALSWDGTYADDDELSNLWTRFNGLYEDFIMQEMGLMLAKWYVLDDGAGAGIEATGSVRIPHEELDGTGEARDRFNEAWWYDFNLPKAAGGQGNYLYQNAAFARRIINAMSAALPMWVDLANVGGHLYVEGNHIYGIMASLKGFSEGYTRLRGEMSADLQQAFEDAFEYLIDFGLSKDPTNLLNNMVTKSVLAMAWIYAGASGTHAARLKAKCVSYAKYLLFGYTDGVLESNHAFAPSATCIYHPAGFVTEASGYDPSYAGRAFSDLIGAWAAVYGEADWAFMEEVLRRFAVWQMYQHFRDADGKWNGPSGYNARTSDPANNTQALKNWDFIWIASVMTEGRPYARNYESQDGTSRLLAEAARVTAINTQITNINANRPIHSFDSRDAPVWTANESWPADTPYHPPGTGWHAALKALVDGADDTTKAFWSRAGTFNFITPGEDIFWAFKGNDGSRDFMWLFEATTAGAFQGWTGGTLSGFAVSDAGIVILSAKDKSSDHGRDFTRIDTWATDHVWGVDAADDYFSSAITDGYAPPRTNARTNDGGGNPATLEHTVVWDAETRETEVAWTGVIETAKTCQPLADGVQVTLVQTSDQADNCKQLWWTIPVFRRKTTQSASTATEIKGWDGAAYQLVTTTEASYRYIRLSRDWGAGRKSVWLDLGASHSVKLSAADYTQAYQSSNKICRNLHIDIHPTGDGTSQAFPASATHVIKVQTTDPGFTGEAIAVTVQYPTAALRVPEGDLLMVQFSTEWGGQTPGDQIIRTSPDNVTYTTVVAAAGIHSQGSNVYDGIFEVPAGTQYIKVVSSNAGATSSGEATVQVTPIALTTDFEDTLTDSDAAALSSHTVAPTNAPGGGWVRESSGATAATIRTSGTIIDATGEAVLGTTQTTTQTLCLDHTAKPAGGFVVEAIMEAPTLGNLAANGEGVAAYQRRSSTGTTSFAALLKSGGLTLGNLGGSSVTKTTKRLTGAAITHAAGKAYRIHAVFYPTSVVCRVTDFDAADAAVDLEGVVGQTVISASDADCTGVKGQTGVVFSYFKAQRF